MTLNILNAIESNDIGQVTHIINSDIKFTQQNSPLGLACSLGNIAIVKILVDAGCKVEWGGALESSPLCLATEAGSSEVVKFLIERKAKLNSKDENGFTPLMIAAATGHLAIVKLLVEAGAKVNIETEHGDFALLSAVVNENYEIYEYLLPLTSSGLINNIDPSIVLPKDREQRVNPSKEFTRLVDTISEVNFKKADSNSYEMNQVHISISNMVDYQGIDFNGLTALHHSIQNTEIITSLLENGFSIVLNVSDNDGNTALISACIHNSIEGVQLLLNAGADTEIKNLKSYTALIETVEFSRSNEIIQLLYNAGANLEAQDIFGNTAIMIAYANSKSKHFSQESQENVELLRSLGASTDRFSEIDFINNAGDGNNNAIIEFIQNGGDINCTGIKGASALKVAVLGNQIDTLNILLENGAVIDNTVDCFISAVYSGYTEIVQRLISAGVNVNIPDTKNGVFAITRAVETINVTIVDILLKAGAKIPKRDPIYGDIVKLAKIVDLEIYKLLINK
jgi:uncharacterized protein